MDEMKREADVYDILTYKRLRRVKNKAKELKRLRDTYESLDELDIKTLEPDMKEAVEKRISLIPKTEEMIDLLRSMMYVIAKKHHGAD